MTKKTEATPAVPHPPAGNVTIATSRRGHRVEDLRTRIRSARRALDSMTPLGSLGTTFPHLAEAQRVQRETLLDQIEQWQGEVKRLEALDGDRLVWELCTPEIQAFEAAKADEGVSLIDTLARRPRPNVVRVTGTRT